MSSEWALSVKCPPANPCMLFALQLFNIEVHRYKATDITIYNQKLSACLLVL
jgi:hypothetical protein